MRPRATTNFSRDIADCICEIVSLDENSLVEALELCQLENRAELPDYLTKRLRLKAGEQVPAAERPTILHQETIDRDHQLLNTPEKSAKGLTDSDYTPSSSSSLESPSLSTSSQIGNQVVPKRGLFDGINRWLQEESQTFDALRSDNHQQYSSDDDLLITTPPKKLLTLNRSGLVAAEKRCPKDLVDRKASMLPTKVGSPTPLFIEKNRIVQDCSSPVMTSTDNDIVAPMPPSNPRVSDSDNDDEYFGHESESKCSDSSLLTLSSNDSRQITADGDANEFKWVAGENQTATSQEEENNLLNTDENDKDPTKPLLAAQPSKEKGPSLLLSTSPNNPLPSFSVMKASLPEKEHILPLIAQEKEQNEPTFDDDDYGDDIVAGRESSLYLDEDMII